MGNSRRYLLSTFDAAVVPADGHCAGGRRSLDAEEKRLAAGGAHAAHVGSGIAAWRTSGLPAIAPGS